MKRNEKGFSAVEGLLIVVIVGLVGFIGWYVWHSKNNADKNFNNASTAASNTGVTKKIAEQTTEATLPANWTTYENKDLRFKFIYPKEWGDAKTENKDENVFPSSKTGHRYQVTFSKQADLTLGLVTKDWSSNPAPREGPCDAIGFTEYKVNEPYILEGEGGSYGKVLVKTDNLYLNEVFATGICGGLRIEGAVKFSKTYAGIEVKYLDTTHNNESGSADDYKKNPDKYIKDSLRQQIVNFTKSIKEL